MDIEGTGYTEEQLTRTPGRKSGCSCCGFTMMGLLALPVLAVVSLFLIF